MRKYSTPYPKTKFKDFQAKYLSSLSPKNTPRLMSKDPEEELPKVSERLKQMIQKYLPEIDFQTEKTSVFEVLDSFEYALDHLVSSLKEKWSKNNEKEKEYFETTRLNLVKYETLLKQKNKDLEIQISSFEQTKLKEYEKIEKEKKNLSALALKLENEILEEKKKFKEQQKTINDELEKIKMFDNKMIKDKIENECREWEFLQKLRMIEEKEAVIELKLKLLQTQEESFYQEKRAFDNEKIKTKLLNEIVKQKNNCIYKHQQSKSLSVNLTKEASKEIHFTDSSKNLNLRTDSSKDEGLDISSFSQELDEMKKSLKNSTFEAEFFKINNSTEFIDWYQQIISLIEEIKDFKILANEKLLALRKFAEKFKDKYELFSSVGTEIKNKDKKISPIEFKLQFHGTSLKQGNTGLEDEEEKLESEKNCEDKSLGYKEKVFHNRREAIQNKLKT